MRTRVLSKLVGLLLLACALPSWAIDCSRAVTLVDNTVCSSKELVWLDETLSKIYQSVLVKDPQHTYQLKQEWQKARDSCTNEACIKNAYLQGISLTANANQKINWRGKWWNTSAVNGSGGWMNISRMSEWDFLVDAEAKAGVHRASYSGEVRKVFGIGIMDSIRNAEGCKLLLVPTGNDEIQVYSNINSGCRLSMPTGVYLDGEYVRAEEDPRPAANLYTIGILNSEQLDRRFRELVGEDYQNFVDTANAYIYRDDEDNVGADVLSLWVRGMAHKKAAIIMYTGDGKIWAARVEPKPGQGKLEMYYYTTEKRVNERVPKTISTWQSGFREQK